MKTLLSRAVLAGFVQLGAGCGDTTTATDETDAGAHDHSTDYATIPGSLAATDVKLDFPEREVAPASDGMMCYFFEPTKAEFFVHDVDVYQGKHGHHLIVMRTIMREKPGSMRDCSKAADMVNLLPIIPAGQGGFDGLPKGMAMRVPKGSQMVLQQHYLNPTENPFKVRDALVLHTMQASDVETQVGFLAVNSGKLSLKDAPGLQESAIHCEAPQDDMNIILLGPHMHEWGRSFTASFTPALGKKQPLLQTDPWQAEYRDKPPYVSYYGKGLVFNKGDAIDVQCFHENDTGAPLEFPQEMCTMYGLFYPAGERQAWICDP